MNGDIFENVEVVEPGLIRMEINEVEPTTTDTGNPENLSFDALDLPCFLVRDDWFDLNGKRKPGVWFCYQTEGSAKSEPQQIAIRICSPLYIDAVTNTEDGQSFGRLLRFRDTLGHWRKWAMPMEMLRGSGEELRGELLAAGVEIEQRSRAKLADYLQWRTPREVVTAAMRGGWTKDGSAFVLRERIIGNENVYFQSEEIHLEGGASTGGDYRQWQALAKLAKGNPVLIVSLCVAFAGPLLALVHRESGGIHWFGDSSIGKSTGLELGVSVWGGADFQRTWRATSNGLEGTAAMLSDTCLCLDELQEADPREVGAIIYSLGNGTGKTRASRSGSARRVHRWRLTIISTGERSITAAMSEGGKQAKAGQLIRLLNIPAARQFGALDNLHHFESGRQFADYIKTDTKKHFGHAGIAFVEHLLKEKQAGADFGGVLAKIEALFSHDDTQAARAAGRFAVFAMAGEIAIEAGILPLEQKAALSACLEMFDQWRETRGSGATEHKQILQAVHDYILKYGDTRFTDKASGTAPKQERAGWYTDRSGERVYLFTPAALREAGGNYDFKRVLVALDSASWIADKDHQQYSKKTAITGGGKPRLYWIKPEYQGGGDA